MQNLKCVNEKTLCTLHSHDSFVDIMLNKVRLTVVVKETKISAVRRHSIQGYYDDDDDDDDNDTVKRKEKKEKVIISSANCLVT